VRDLNIKLRPHRVLRDVSLDVAKGEMWR